MVLQCQPRDDHTGSAKASKTLVRFTQQLANESTYAVHQIDSEKIVSVFECMSTFCTFLCSLQISEEFRSLYRLWLYTLTGVCIVYVNELEKWELYIPPLVPSYSETTVSSNT
jgi:hypothetical protein